jgi:hypothetical protein
MRSKAILVATALAITAIGCRSTTMSPKDYIAYSSTPKSGLVKAYEIGGMQYTVSLRTPQWYTLMEMMQADGKLDKEAFAQKLKVREGALYLLVSVKPISGNQSLVTNGVNGMEQYDNRIRYYQFEAQRDFHLQVNDTEIPAGPYFFEYNYELSPESKFLVQYNLPSGTKGKLNLRFDDQVTGNVLTARFNTEDIDQLPALSF